MVRCAVFLCVLTLYQSTQAMVQELNSEAVQIYAQHGFLLKLCQGALQANWLFCPQILTGLADIDHGDGWHRYFAFDWNQKNIDTITAGSGVASEDITWYLIRVPVPQV